MQLNWNLNKICYSPIKLYGRTKVLSYKPTMISNTDVHRLLSWVHTYDQLLSNRTSIRSALAAAMISRTVVCLLLKVVTITSHSPVTRGPGLRLSSFVARAHRQLSIQLCRSLSWLLVATHLVRRAIVHAEQIWVYVSTWRNPQYIVYAIAFFTVIPNFLIISRQYTLLFAEA